MTVDARALVAIVCKEPGFERFVEVIAEDPTPRVAATAVAEAAIILTARGEPMAYLTLQIIVERLNLTIVPFTKEHWKIAVDEYERMAKKGSGKKPAFGHCLSAAVASKLGAPIIE